MSQRAAGSGSAWRCLPSPLAGHESHHPSGPPSSLCLLPLRASTVCRTGQTSGRTRMPLCMCHVLLCLISRSRSRSVALFAIFFSFFAPERVSPATPPPPPAGSVPGPAGGRRQSGGTRCRQFRPSGACLFNSGKQEESAAAVAFRRR